MGAPPYQICRRCVMDTTDENIAFDDRGYCNHCETYIQTISTEAYIPGVSEKQWKHVLKTIKERGKGKKYDCLVGISGGVDSCYTAHLCKEYGLRPLLMHVDNGWDTEIAVKNVKKMVEKLGFDYISYVIDWNEFREIQLAFLKSSIVDLEMPTDIAIAAANYKIAAKYGIPTILSGGNYSGEGILPLQWGYHVYTDMKLYKYIVRRYSKVSLKKVPVVGFYGNFYYKFIKRIKSIYPLNYIPYNKDDARQFLMNNYEWGDYGGKHHESKITAFWQSYVMPEKYNMDYRRATFSSQICENQITRETALEKLKEVPYNEAAVGKDKEFIAKKFGITVGELEGYLKKVPKTYVDFPNDKAKIERYYNLYRKLFKR